VQYEKDPLPDDLHLSAEQAKTLEKLDVNLVNHPPVLELAVSRQRDALAVRKAGVVNLVARIETLEAVADGAAEAEVKALCRIHASETASEVSAWDADFRAERKTRLEAESELAELRDKYQTLTAAVPVLAQAHTARRRRRIEASGVAQTVRDARADITQVLKILPRYAMRQSWEIEAHCGEWWPYLRAKLPSAIIETYQEGLRIDGDVVDAHIKYLLADGIDNLYEIYNACRNALRREVRDCEKVVRTLAETGRVEVDALTDLLASDERTSSSVEPSPPESDTTSSVDLSTDGDRDE
jgi:hypothetical protein